MFGTLDDSTMCCEIPLAANCPLKSQLSHIWNQKNVPVLDHILSHMETLDDFYSGDSAALTAPSASICFQDVLSVD